MGGGVTFHHLYHTNRGAQNSWSLVSTILIITTHKPTPLVLEPEGIIAQTPKPSTVVGQYNPYLILTGCGGDSPEFNSRHGEGIFFLIQNVHTGYGAVLEKRPEHEADHYRDEEWVELYLIYAMRSWRAQERLHIFTSTKYRFALFRSWSPKWPMGIFLRRQNFGFLFSLPVVHVQHFAESCHCCCKHTWLYV